MKTCKKCGSEHDRHRCPSCKIKYDREWRARNLDKKIKSQREYRERNPKCDRPATLKRKYGITVSQWDELFLRQGLKCAICGSTCSTKCDKWHTDHCHTTGKVRGILCHNCNRGLGYLKDDPDLLSRGIDYLNNPPFNYDNEK